jgi:hypothetical protein
MTTSQPCLCPTTTRYMASKVPCDRSGDRAISVPQTNLSPPNSLMSQLRDGRTLGAVEFGPRSGNVIFYFHGYPGSRFEGRFLSEPAERFGIRLIGLIGPEWASPTSNQSTTPRLGLARSDISYPCCPAACRGFCARSWRIFFKTTNELQRCSADLRGGGLRLTGRVLICLVSATSR